MIRTLRDTMVEEMAQKYGVDTQAAQTAVDTYAGQLDDEDLYDEGTDSFSRDGAELIRDSFAAEYGTLSVDHSDYLDNINTLTRSQENALRNAEDYGEARDSQIRKAIEAGVRVASIAEAAGLSIPRVYQIRDKRR